MFPVTLLTGSFETFVVYSPLEPTVYLEFLRPLKGPDSPPEDSSTSDLKRLWVRLSMSNLSTGGTGERNGSFRHYTNSMFMTAQVGFWRAVRADLKQSVYEIKLLFTTCSRLFNPPVQLYRLLVPFRRET